MPTDTVKLKTNTPPPDYFPYLQKKLYCDFRFCCKDGQVIDAHKLILAACSRPLDRIFNNLKDIQPTIYVSHDRETLDSMLNMVYKGQVSVSQELSRKVLELATSFEIKCAKVSEEILVLNSISLSEDFAEDHTTDISTPSNLSESNQNHISTNGEADSVSRPSEEIINSDLIYSEIRGNGMDVSLTEETEYERNLAKEKTSTPQNSSKRRSPDDETPKGSPSKHTKIVINPVRIKIERLKANVVSSRNTQTSMEPQVSTSSSSSNSNISEDAFKRFLETPMAELRDTYCLVCDEFLDDYEWKRHKRQHQLWDSWNCKYCWRIFHLKENLKYHLKICQQRDD